ncbi:MAG: AraC family transcriptional regulator [Spirochaetales bacterium]|nr:AraC family transcriptional regulator [Spirochaetales bacterium]
MDIIDIVFVYHLRDDRQIAWHGRKHMHDSHMYELHYFISGVGSFLNGSTTWNITPGSLHITSPGILHQIIATEDRKPITYYAVLFDAFEDGELQTLLERFKTSHAPFEMGTSHRFFFANLLEKHFSKKQDLILAARHNFLAFLYDLSAGLSAYGPLENAHVEKALAIMQNSIEKNLTLTELCSRLQLSHEHFVRVFSERIGMPPMRYYTQLKMEAARAMLSSTNLRIQEIADKLGFSNQFNFTRTFKRYTQQSPSIFRSQCLQRADFSHL